MAATIINCAAAEAVLASTMPIVAGQPSAGFSRHFWASESVAAVELTSPAAKPASGSPQRGPKHAHGDVAAEADPGDEHQHEPEPGRVDQVPRIDRTVGQQRQHDEGDDQEGQRGGDLLFLDARLGELWMLGLSASMASMITASMPASQGVAAGQVAEDEGGHGGDLGGQADVGALPGRALSCT